MMPWTNVLFLFVIWIVEALYARERIYYMDVDRVNLTYYNPRYYAFANVTARRHSRTDPIHYVDLHSETLVPFGDNVSVDVFVYEFLSNEYRRSFVEMHYNVCDMMMDKIAGPIVNRWLPKNCFFPKGTYHIVNMSIPDLPLFKTFPFTKGRVFIHIKLEPRRERLYEGYCDAVIKQRWR